MKTLNEKQLKRAEEIGSIIAQVEILAINVKVSGVSVNQKDIVSKLKKISEKLNKLEL